MTKCRRVLAGLAVGALLLTGCSTEQNVAGASKVEHSTVADIAGSALKLVTLSARAQQRLGVRTVAVRPGSGGRTVIPYSAVIYDVEGSTWAFVASSGGAFRRVAMTVDDIVGQDAYLTAGPALGTRVVSVGAAELYGAELGVGK